MKLEDFDFRVWVGGFAIANGKVWNGGYIDDSYMKKKPIQQSNSNGISKVLRQKQRKT